MMFKHKTPLTRFVLVALVLGALSVVAACGGNAATATVAPTVDDTGADSDMLVETPTAEGDMAEGDMAEGDMVEEPTAEDDMNDAAEAATVTAEAAVATTLYEEPSADSAEVMALEPGQAMTLEGQRDVETVTWVYAVLATGEEGWVMAADVTPDTDLSALPSQ